MVSAEERFERAYRVGADPHRAYLDPDYFEYKVVALESLSEEQRYRLRALRIAAEFVAKVGRGESESVDDLAQRVIELAEQIYQEIMRVPREVELATMPYDEYLQTPEWHEKRQGVYQRAQNRCQVCNSPGPLQAHHRTYERRGNELPEDLVALCDRCHSLFHRHLTVTP